MRKSKKITKNIENLFTSIVYGTYKQYIAAKTTNNNEKQQQ